MSGPGTSSCRSPLQPPPAPSPRLPAPPPHRQPPRQQRCCCWLARLLLRRPPPRLRPQALPCPLCAAVGAGLSGSAPALPAAPRFPGSGGRSWPAEQQAETDLRPQQQGMEQRSGLSRRRCTRAAVFARVCMRASRALCAGSAQPRAPTPTYPHPRTHAPTHARMHAYARTCRLRAARARRGRGGPWASGRRCHGRCCPRIAVIAARCRLGRRRRARPCLARGSCLQKGGVQPCCNSHAETTQRTAC